MSRNIGRNDEIDNLNAAIKNAKPRKGYRSNGGVERKLWRHPNYREDKGLIILWWSPSQATSKSRCRCSSRALVDR